MLLGGRSATTREPIIRWGYWVSWEKLGPVGPKSGSRVIRQQRRQQDRNQYDCFWRRTDKQDVGIYRNLSRHVDRHGTRMIPWVCNPNRGEGREPPHRRSPQAGAPPAGGGGGQGAQGGPTQAGEGPHKATPTPTQEGAPPGDPTQRKRRGRGRTK